MKTWFVVPARGGSRGVPRKAMRLIHGKPLCRYSIETLLQVVPASQIFFATDDDELEAIALLDGINILREEETTGKATLDEVTLKFIEEIKSHGAKDEDLLLTVQPTCPMISRSTLEKAIEKIRNGAASVITVMDDRHLGWHYDENNNLKPTYAKRVNRQFLPSQFRESGAIIGARIGDILKNKTRIIAPIELIEISKEEGLDIDDFSDLMMARYLLGRKKIIIRADGNVNMGMGHLYRAVALAQEMAQHDLKLVTLSRNENDLLSYNFLSRFPFVVEKVRSNEEMIDLVRSDPADIVILDQLDTEREYILSLKSHAKKIITFEDMGVGAKEADLLISDLYKNPLVEDKKQLWGIEYSILAPSFESIKFNVNLGKEVSNILLLFGGTDPSNLTEKALNALSLIEYNGNVLLVQGSGRKNKISDLGLWNLRGTILNDVKYMPGVMKEADLAISSAGRTISELLSIGVPTICLCQNEKELGHTHATANHGVLNLGLGNLVDTAHLASEITKVLNDYELRKQMSASALQVTRDRDNRKIVEKILKLVGLEIL